MNKKRSKVITLSVPIDFLKEVDKLAKKQGRTRSEMAREGMRRCMNDEQQWAELQKYGQQKAQELGVTSEEDVQRLVDEVRHNPSTKGASRRS